MQVGPQVTLQVGAQEWTGAQVNPKQVGPPAQVWMPPQWVGPPQVIGLQVCPQVWMPPQ
jgi:hypothetical protein